MKYISTNLLRLAVVFLGLVMVLACLFFFPGFTQGAVEMVPTLDSWKYGILGVLCGTAIPLVIATFAAVLQKLLQQGIEFKAENDLTV